MYFDGIQEKKYLLVLKIVPKLMGTLTQSILYFRKYIQSNAKPRDLHVVMFAVYGHECKSIIDSYVHNLAKLTACSTSI